LFDNIAGIFGFMSPLENKRDTFSENINFIIEDLSGQGITLADYAKITKQQLGASIKDFEIVDEGVNTSEDGMKSYNLIYDGEGQQGRDLRWQLKVMMLDETAYVITYTAERDSFDKFHDQAREIARSWDFQ